MTPGTGNCKLPPASCQLHAATCHPKLNHGWLWKEIDAYVKENVGLQQEIDLDEAPEPELPDQSPDQIDVAGPEDEGSEIELPEPDESADTPLGTSWREVLAQLRYPREKVMVTHEERIGESERDLTGTGFITTIAYSDSERDAPDGFVPPSEDLPLAERRSELTDQILELARELLLENGLPPSGISVLYRALLEHTSDKFLDGKTIGQCESEPQILFVQDSLHYVRRNLSQRPLLKAILDDPPEV